MTPIMYCCEAAKDLYDEIEHAQKAEPFDPERVREAWKALDLHKTQGHPWHIATAKEKGCAR